MFVDLNGLFHKIVFSYFFPSLDITLIKMYSWYLVDTVYYNEVVQFCADVREMFNEIQENSEQHQGFPHLLIPFDLLS